MKTKLLSYSISLALLSPALAVADEAEWTFSGFLKNETALFTQSGTTNGAANAHDSGDVYKSETSLNLFVNGELNENLSAHAQFNLIRDFRADIKDYQGSKSYSQHDYLRELYVDYSWDNVDIRLGKQQVVWGTADGIKLLDIINPTDFREFSQNTMEDSRIPVWMLKADIALSDNTDLQLIAAQVEENKIPGLNADGDQGHPFMMKGVDSITGSRNGFLNIVPALGGTAFAFTGFAAQFTQFQSGKLESVGGNTFTVQNFVDGFSPFCPNGAPPASMGLPPMSCSQFLNMVAQTDGLGGNQDRTNLVTDTFDATNPDNTFEYMAQASFTTFDTFAGAQSTYKRAYPDGNTPNLGFRLKSSLDNGLNYSLNYLYHYDANPVVSIGWEDQNGQKLTPYMTESTGVTGETVRTMRLAKADGTPFNANDPLGANDGAANMVFTESLNRVHSIGASFDTALDTSFLGPVVLRGEFLYDKGGMVPVVDRDALAVGDLANGLKPMEADFFKYVLGLDVTVMTNLMISAQFIQFYNLDYIDEVGKGWGQGENTGRYTADPATLHLSNGLQRGEKVDNFVSLFFSKPFGEGQLGRVNNITLYEEGGGYWNRLDAEYSFTDTLIGTAEWNHYWGDENTTFGQMHNASNVQIGLKYLFE